MTGYKVGRVLADIDAGRITVIRTPIPVVMVADDTDLGPLGERTYGQTVLDVLDSGLANESNKHRAGGRVLALTGAGLMHLATTS